MTKGETTVERLRAALAERGDVVERRMMGGTCFMVAGHMCCGASGERLMARVGREDYAAALLEAHVRPLDLGGRRPVGYVLVEAEGFADEDQLRRWLARAIAVVDILPAR